MSQQNDRTKFDVFSINLLNPIEASWKIAGWLMVGIPFMVAVVWGIYNPDNLFSVLGISGRRAGGAFINETRPVGESLLNGASGTGFRPGITGGTQDEQRDSLRPGVVEQ
ncbi:hypothetical protein IQ268_09065 [Oculatella sp. LEGE 06141]|uniref:hypothetical protein n=1 Tax=Oculatella sp. LEGE 06141 TaxID=1828648 RepID=UPI0018821D8B|nr:hypothetical protein [Oculatella sp. LEGE 06141]MBE9178709.1 hypothetical protein [Oculatella sp. LEGE 06141]